MSRLFAALMTLLPTLAAAQLSGTTFPIDTSNGEQTDPHVSCDGAAYTSDLNGSSEIRFYSFTSSSFVSIANGGNQDLLSDVSGSTVVFTRFFPDGHSGIFTYDTTTTVSTELAPSPTSQRQNAAIGGNTVAWEDYELVTGSMPAPEIVGFVRPGGPAVRLTFDTVPDLDPAVSQDGQVIVFAKCNASGVGCDIYKSVALAPAVAVTSNGATSNETSPDTNGQVITYQSDLDGDLDIYFAPVVTGGPAGHLNLAGIQRNPNISGTLIAFESQDPVSGNFDIYVYDYVTGNLYQVTATPTLSEQLNDVVVCGSDVRLVWSQLGPNGDFDVVGFIGHIVATPPPPVCQQDPALVCANPGARPLLATATVVRTAGKPNVTQTNFISSDDEGVLCIDNQQATAGWVELNCKLEVGPSSFQQSTTLIAKSVDLQQYNKLQLTISGQPGTRYTARVYGDDPACTPPPPSDDDDDGHHDDDDDGHGGGGHDDDDDGHGGGGGHDDDDDGHGGGGGGHDDDDDGHGGGGGHDDDDDGHGGGGGGHDDDDDGHGGGGGHDDDDDGHGGGGGGHDDDDDGHGKSFASSSGPRTPQASAFRPLPRIRLAALSDGTRQLADTGDAPQFEALAGCSSSAGTSAVAGILLFLGMLLMRRTRAPAPVRTDDRR